jgi:predicted N-acetyltransferase YhbS
MSLTDADDAQIETVLEGTHALWSDGLDRGAYLAFVRALRQTAWGRRGGYRFVVMPDEAGRILCAMKLYRFEARAGGRPITVGGVGALFTPPDRRGRGHAARLLERAHEEMAARGDAASLLHSEIGDAYYARLGYRRLDPDAARLQVPETGAAVGAAGHLRRLGPGESPDILRRLRDTEDGQAPFALTHDEAYREYLLMRAEIPSTHLGERRWQSRLVVDERGGEVRGYLWSLLREPSDASAHDGGAAARVLEFAEASAGASLPRLLDDLFGACRRRGIASVEAWQAGELARRDPRLSRPGAMRRSEALPVVPMWRPLCEPAASGLPEAFAGASLLLSDVF